MTLPVFLDAAQFVTMQTNWATQLNPLLLNPLFSGALIKQLKIISGINHIAHTLNRACTGYVITRMRGGFVEIYDSQDTNPTPTKTLTLHSSGPAIVDVYVF